MGHPFMRGHEVLKLLSAPGAIAREPDQEINRAGAIYRINGLGRNISQKTIEGLAKSGKLKQITAPVFSERLGRYIITIAYRKAREEED
jgi:hypothetical protein